MCHIQTFFYPQHCVDGMILPCMLYQVVAEEYLQTGQYSPEHLLKLEIVINKRCIFVEQQKWEKRRKQYTLEKLCLSVLFQFYSFTKTLTPFLCL